MESELTDITRANLRIDTLSLQLREAESKLEERDREVEGMEMAAKGDVDLIALLRKQVDWCRQHMAYEPEPDWSEVMKEHHALTPEEKPHE